MKTFLLIFTLIFATNVLNAQSFSVLLDRIQSLPAGEKTKQLDEYFNGNHAVPVIENNTTVYFIYKGIASSVSVAGDATGWSPTLKMQKIAGTNYWYAIAQYETDARIEYKIVVDETNWKLDPMNERISHGGMGDNSELVMPQYVPPFYIYERDVVPWGTYADTVIYSKYLKENRQLRIYLPPHYEVTDALYPVIIFHDGFELFDRMAVRNVLDNMTFERKIRPMIAVFVPPVHRDQEYSGKLQKKYSKFISDELVSFLDKNYRTVKDPGYRATAGISNGGNISLWLAATKPDVFGKAGAQSSNVEKNVLKAFGKNDLSGSRIYLDFGKYDLPELMPKIQSLNQILEQRAIPHSYHECPEGHNWGAWQKHLPDMLEYLFPRDGE
jgi:enterochelin esterase family protein